MVSYEVDGLDCHETDGEKIDEDKKNDFYLENSWKEIITDNETIPDKQRVQQEAIWELFATEISYIRDIKIIIDVSNFLLNPNQKQSPEVFCKKGVLGKFGKIHRKAPVPEPLFQ